MDVSWAAGLVQASEALLGAIKRRLPLSWRSGGSCGIAFAHLPAVPGLSWHGSPHPGVGLNASFPCLCTHPSYCTLRAEQGLPDRKFSVPFEQPLPPRLSRGLAGLVSRCIPLVDTIGRRLLRHGESQDLASGVALERARVQRCVATPWHGWCLGRPPAGAEASAGVVGRRGGGDCTGSGSGCNYCC